MLQFPAKYTFCLVAAIVCITGVNAQSIHSGVTGTLSFGFQTGTTIQNNLLTDVTLSYSDKNAILFTGFNAYERSFDSVSAIAVMPYTNHFFSFGLVALMHFGMIEDIAHEVDFGGLALFSFFGGPSSDQWCFTLSAGYMEKYLTVHALGSFRPEIIDDFVFMSLDFSKRLFERFEFGLGLGSFQLYEYSAFALPAFHFNVQYHVESTTSVGMDVYVQYTDFFTLTAYVRGVQVRLQLVHHF